MRKAPRKIDSDWSHKYKYNDDDTDESQDSQSNNEANSDKMEDL